MLVFGSVLLTDSTEICLFRITSLGWSQILAKINEGDVFLLPLSIFVARESQCLQWSHPAKSLGQAANFEAQLTTKNSTTTTTTQLRFLITLQVLVRGSFVLGEAISLGRSIGPRKLWNAGALKRVIHPYLLVSFAYNELLLKLHLFPDVPRR